ncbi:MAG: hypothetical protein ACTHJ4_04310 [Candidatus Nucleicultricaceae bacterium]
MTEKECAGKEKVIMPHIEEVMLSHKGVNVICSGCKTEFSETFNFDPQRVINKFKMLMWRLPIQMAVFSPKIGGVECYAVVSNYVLGVFEVVEIHNDPRYKEWVGRFKKPDVGMFVVIRDLVREYRGIDVIAENTLMVGDSWQDEKAALDFGLPFLNAKHVHTNTVRDSSLDKKHFFHKIPIFS